MEDVCHRVRVSLPQEHSTLVMDFFNLVASENSGVLTSGSHLYKKGFVNGVWDGGSFAGTFGLILGHLSMTVSFAASQFWC